MKKNIDCRDKIINTETVLPRVKPMMKKSYWVKIEEYFVMYYCHPSNI